MNTLEARFDVILRDNGVFILLTARAYPPFSSTTLGFNGKDLALLSRDEQEDIILSGLKKEVIRALQKKPPIFVWELDGTGQIVFEYSPSFFLDPDLSLRDLL